MSICKISLVLLLLALEINLRGESYPPTFRSVTTGSDLMFTTQLGADSVGNTFWAGYFDGAMQSVGSLSFTNQNHQSSYGAFLFKLGPNMEERWGKSGGGMAGGTFRNFHGVVGLAVDTNRDCYVAVCARSSALVFDNVTYNSPSNLFSVVIKYSRGGDKIWARRVDGFHADSSQKALCIDHEQNVFIAGYQGAQGVLQKLNTAGQPLWSRYHWASDAQVQTDPAGNCFLLSSFFDSTSTFGTITVTNRGVRNFVLVKYDAAGNELWAKVGGGMGPGEDQGMDLALDANGNAYVLSAIRSTNAVFGTNYFTVTNSAWFVTKYNNDGRALWATQVDTMFDSPIGGISIDHSNHLLLTATSFSVGQPVSFLGSYTADGQLLWKKQGRPVDDVPVLVWNSRMIDVPEVGMAAAGIAGSVALDPFVLPELPRPIFTTLNYDPRLSSSREGDFLTLSWPTNEAGFFLESSDSLDGTDEWLVVTNSVVLLNGQNVVTNIASEANQFYRLRKAQP